MHPAHVRPDPVGTGTGTGRSSSSPSGEPFEVADARDLRARAGHADLLAGQVARDLTVVGLFRLADRRQGVPVGGCSDLEAAVLALHGGRQFAVAARLASASPEGQSYTRALAVKHDIVAAPGERHRYVLAVRAFAAEDRFLTQRAHALHGSLGEHLAAEPSGGAPAALDAYLRLLLAHHRITESDGEPAADLARRALLAEADSLQLAARRMAAWARVIAEWLCPGIDRIASSRLADPPLPTAGHTLIC